MKVLAIITARGGSKGIPKKNLFPLNGKPLIEYTISAAKKAKKLDRIILSTDCTEIANVAKKLDLEVPFLRPKELASDEASSRDVIIHAIDFFEKREGYIPDAVMILQPTSPFRTSEDIDNCIKLLEDNVEVDSIVSIVKVPHSYSPESAFLIGEDKKVVPINSNVSVFRRQEKQQYYARNGAAVYISRVEVFQNSNIGGVLGKKVIGYEMSLVSSIDIDSFEDLYIADSLANSINFSSWMKGQKN